MKVGLYIKDVKMPKAGQVIEISEGITGTVYARISPGFDKWHPVIPVPPHGRLGDMDEIERYKERLVVDADKIKSGIRYVVDTKYIKEAPTIIPKEKEA